MPRRFFWFRAARRLSLVRRGYLVRVTFDDGPAVEQVCKFPSRDWLATTLMLLLDPEDVQEILSATTR